MRPSRYRSAAWSAPKCKISLNPVCLRWASKSSGSKKLGKGSPMPAAGRCVELRSWRRKANESSAAPRMTYCEMPRSIAMLSSSSDIGCAVQKEYACVGSQASREHQTPCEVLRRLQNLRGRVRKGPPGSLARHRACNEPRGAARLRLPFGLGLAFVRGPDAGDGQNGMPERYRVPPMRQPFGAVIS